MRKLYTLLSAALISAAAVAAPAAPKALESYARQFTKETLQKRHATERFEVAKLPHGNAVSSNLQKKAPARTTSLLTRPDGTAKQYIRDSYSYLVFWGMVFNMEDTGGAVEIISTEDGQSYISNIIGGFSLPNWFECTVTDDKIIIPGHQFIDEDETGRVWLEVMEYFYDEDEDMEGYRVSDRSEFELTYSDGVYSSADFDEWGEYILGIYFEDLEDSYYSGWAGYGDYNYNIAPFNKTTVSVPDGLETETWALIQGETGNMVNVAVTDDAVYLQGLFGDFSDAWLKGDLEGDKVTLPLSTYLGVYGGYRFFCQSAEIEQEWNEDYEEYEITVYPSDEPVVFTYDAANKKLLSTGGLAVTYGEPDPDSWYIYESLLAPEIFYQHRTPGIAPCAPRDITDYPDDDYPAFSFVLPQFDVEGNLLDADRLFYNVYVDGELFTFYPDEYEYFEEEMTDIPYAFTDNYDIDVSGALHIVYYYWYGVDSIGVQAYYLEADGSKTYSELTTLGESRVSEISEENSVTLYYDLNGLRVANPDKGFFIKKTIGKDGKTKAVKVVR